MDFRPLTEYLDALEDIGVSGSDTLVYTGGRVAYRHMTGLIDREAGRAPSEDTVYQMYSMTKPMTVVCAMQLYERGVFLLEDPVSQYLPEFANVRVRTQDSYGAARLTPPREPMRVRHLMTMTAGFNYDLESDGLRALYARSPQFTTREFARAMADVPLDFEPGTHYRYSLCHDVLGALIEVWSGMRFADYMKKNLFDPLGLESAWFHVPESQLARRAAVYTRQSGGAFTRLPYINAHQRSACMDSGGAGLSCTAGDYMTFAAALLHGGSGVNGQRVIGRETLRMMCMNQLEGDCLRDYRDLSRQGYGYGLGLRTLMEKAPAGSAGGVGEFGWGGAAGTYLMVDPERDVAVVFAEQSLPGHNAVVHRRIRNILYRALE